MSTHAEVGKNRFHLRAGVVETVEEASSNRSDSSASLFLSVERRPARRRRVFSLLFIDSITSILVPECSSNGPEDYPSHL